MCIYINSITLRRLTSRTVTSYFGGSGFEIFTRKQLPFVRAFMVLNPTVNKGVGETNYVMTACSCVLCNSSTSGNALG